MTMANRDVAMPIAATSAGSTTAAATSPASANAARDASTLAKPRTKTEASATPTRVCLHIVSSAHRAVGCIVPVARPRMTEMAD